MYLHWACLDFTLFESTPKGPPNTQLWCKCVVIYGFMSCLGCRTFGHAWCIFSLRAGQWHATGLQDCRWWLGQLDTRRAEGRAKTWWVLAGPGLDKSPNRFMERNQKSKGKEEERQRKREEKPDLGKRDDVPERPQGGMGSSGCGCNRLCQSLGYFKFHLVLWVALSCIMASHWIDTGPMKWNLKLLPPSQPRWALRCPTATTLPETALWF